MKLPIMQAGLRSEVYLQEPQRYQFAYNVRGALEYLLAHWIYGILETMGTFIGAFLSGVAVQFLEQIEPSLVKYSRPLMDSLLSVPELDANIRSFFEQLRAPTDEGAAAMLSSVSGAMGGAVAGAVFNTLLAPVTYALNKVMRPAIPNPGELVAMYRRGAIGHDGLAEALARAGYKQDFITGYERITESLVSVGDLIEALYRGDISQGEYATRLAAMGVPNADANIAFGNRRNLLSGDVLLACLHRGLLTQADVLQTLQRIGYTGEDASRLLDAVKPMPGPGDLVRFAVRESYDEQVVQQWGYDESLQPRFVEDMAKLGYDPRWASYFWRAHWELPSPTQGREFVHRGAINEWEYGNMLRVADYPAFWRDKFLQVLYEPYTRVDTRRMYGLGVLDRNGVYLNYRALGYDHEHATNLTTFTIKYEDEITANKLDHYKSLTQTTIVNAYKKGIISRQETITRLGEIGFEGDEINILLSLAEYNAVIDDIPDMTSSFRNDIRGLAERSYKDGVLDRSNAEGMLTEGGYTDAQAGFILDYVDAINDYTITDTAINGIGDSYVNRSIDLQDAIAGLGALNVTGNRQQKLLQQWGVRRSIGTRRLTEAQYRKAFFSGLISMQEYQESLAGLGYTPKDVKILAWLMVPPTPGESELPSTPA